ncbi:MAG: hypothetical protein L3J67_02075 [Hyphomicrobiaceae bacterium]|nr:hypothetical protein [Hyphomicrobiaceae bacterium]
MSIIIVMAIIAAIGLGVFIFWVLTGLNFKYAGFLGSIMQGLIITPFLAVGGVCAFFLFSHFFGVKSVALLDASGLQDILLMVGGAAALGGIPVGVLGYFSSKMPS